MTMYAPSDMHEINIGPAHGGCGQRHVRDGDPWGVDCAQCQDYLRADGRWSPTLHGIQETFDEKLAREDWDKRGVRDRDAIAALAMARMAGLGPSEIPESVTRMLTGLPRHVVAGQILCPKGHASSLPGMKFCGECGSPLSRPAVAGELTGASA